MPCLGAAVTLRLENHFPGKEVMMNTPRHFSIPAALLLAASSAFAFANSAKSSTAAATLATSDKEFLMDVARANVAEIELGKLAEQKGANTAVKDFGSRMVRDHAALNGQLDRIASPFHLTLPTTITGADREQEAKLENLSGQAFDHAYVQAMLKDHEADVKLVQEKAATAPTPAVKSFAEHILPTLEDHLRIAEYDAGKMGIAPRMGLNEREHANLSAGMR